MLFIRPVTEADLPAVEQLAATAGVGMTSIPQNTKLLASRISQSVCSFAQQQVTQPGQERYLFVLEDSSKGQVVGLSGIEAAVGLLEPFYSYRLGTVVHASAKYKIHKQVPALYLCNDYTGQTEIGSLILAKHYRQGYNGKLLSYSRFLFMAEFPQRFAEKVFAEMRGVCDDKGHSPFWHGLGRHFFQMEFPMADYLSGADSKSFIAQLMPTHPIYVPLLSEDAQRVIAQPHPQTRSALALLKRQGFEFSNYIDIFDGGPTVDSPLQKIKMVRHSKPLQIVDCVSNLSVGAELPALLANTQLADFRCCVADYQICGEEGIAISAMVAQQLGVHKGDWVRGVPFAVTEQQADSSKPG